MAVENPIPNDMAMKTKLFPNETAANSVGPNFPTIILSTIPTTVCPNIPKITIYGPLVQGNKNKLTIKPIKKALSGPVIDLTKDFNFGRQLKGTSIKNPFPYQKKSFTLNKPIKIAMIPITFINTTGVPKLEITEYRPIPIKK